MQLPYAKLNRALVGDGTKVWQLRLRVGAAVAAVRVRRQGRLSGCVPAIAGDLHEILGVHVKNMREQAVNQCMNFPRLAGASTARPVDNIEM